MHHIEHDSSNSASLVQMRTIDFYDLRPAIIKIDVEGYEAEVLAGAMETASRPELIAIITEQNDDSMKYGNGIPSVASFMTRYGFTAVTYDPWQGLIRTKVKPSDNTLYIRDMAMAKAKQRVAEAPPFRVFGRSI